MNDFYWVISGLGGVFFLAHTDLLSPKLLPPPLCPLRHGVKVFCCVSVSLVLCVFIPFCLCNVKMKQAEKSMSCLGIDLV